MGTRFNMIGIFVENLPEMVRFYRDVIGVAIEWDGNGPYAEFSHEGIRFSMYERNRLPSLLGRDPGYPAGLNGTFELAVDLPRFEDVDLEFRRVLLAGAQPVYGPRNEPWGMRSSMIADPEGNLIEIGSWNTGKGEGGAQAEDLCPVCRAMRPLRITRDTEKTERENRPARYVTRTVYNCAVCGVFVKSEDLPVE